MKKIITLSTFFLITIWMSSTLSAQSPRISIQGTLKDADGVILNDGKHDITFRLYLDRDGGNAIYMERDSVDVRGGFYDHKLGSIVPLNPSDFDNQLYLGIEIGDLELRPRNEIAYAPYTVSTVTAVNAINAVNAEHATYTDFAPLAIKSEKAKAVRCSGAVGDVKYSILNPTQFATVNGDCWVPLNGGNHAGSKLSSYTNSGSVPNLSGLFIRAQEYNENPNYDPNRTPASSIATVQADDIKSHSHTTGNLMSAYGATISGNGLDGDATLVTTTGSRGSESRGKNRNFYAYIRIN